MHHIIYTKFCCISVSHIPLFSIIAHEMQLSGERQMDLRMSRVRQDTCACTVGYKYRPEALNSLHIFPLICPCTCVMVTIDAVDKKSKIMLPNPPQNSLLSTTQDGLFQHQLSTAHSRKCFLRCVFLLRDY